jgi:hypothetical protein
MALLASFEEVAEAAFSEAATQGGGQRHGGTQRQESSGEVFKDGTTLGTPGPRMGRAASVPAPGSGKASRAGVQRKRVKRTPASAAAAFA